MKALILHAWYEKPENNWYSWLKQELEKRRYQVYLPELPTMDTDLPDMKKQLDFIKNLLTINRNMIIFGHSIGCLLAMRLAEKYLFKKMFLISGWDFNDLTKEHRLFWPNALDHEKIKKNVSEIYCISSDNDPYCTYFINEQMSKRLGGKSVLIKGAGHFTDTFGIKEIPQLLQYV